jgi:hypothetical protein
MKDYTKALCEILANHNWKFKRHGKGDHDIWKSPDGKKIMAIPLVYGIRRSVRIVFSVNRFWAIEREIYFYLLGRK